MRHPGAGAMGEDKARAGLRGAVQERGDLARLCDLDIERLRGDGFHLVCNGRFRRLPSCARR